jgi:hypothetical protein
VELADQQSDRKIIKVQTLKQLRAKFMIKLIFLVIEFLNFTRKSLMTEIAKKEVVAPEVCPGGWSGEQGVR